MITPRHIWILTQLIIFVLRTKSDNVESCSATNSKVDCGDVIKSQNDDPNEVIDESLNDLDQEDPKLIEAIYNRIIPIPPLLTPYNFSDPHFVKMTGQFHEAEYLAKEIFGNQRRGFFIEAGAFEGETLSNTLYFEATKGWTGLLIEPNPDLFEQMKTKKRKANLFGHCLSTKNRAEVVEFDAAGVYGGIIKDGRKPGADGLPMPGTVYDFDRRTIRMQCFPLYSILLALGNPTVDLLSLDIEGAELQVLQAIPWDKVDIQVLVIEAHQVGKIFENDGESLEEFMMKRGYQLHVRIHINHVYIKNDFVPQKLEKPFIPNFRDIA